jgi:hypothetical protein
MDMIEAQRHKGRKDSDSGTKVALGVVQIVARLHNNIGFREI